MAQRKICTTCGSESGAVGFGGGDVAFLGIILGVGFMAAVYFSSCVLVVVGFVLAGAYAIVTDQRAKGCKACGTKTLIPVDSPRGKELAAKHASSSKEPPPTV